jgi:hypothetical protein
LGYRDREGYRYRYGDIDIHRDIEMEIKELSEKKVLGYRDRDIEIEIWRYRYTKRYINGD